ncbi:hypothetical protein DFH08DRAFT_797093 [Mycena albidolilacea]|uniref:Uncharacterized protein n=1 Tax=Mycena albidolilacea TaxID=1033008 RepID=A0AAD7F2U2_9AGAR|nr:hypothetical protein DFH08DRAFT_797093 [Mycena albidolilacea]
MCRDFFESLNVYSHPKIIQFREHRANKYGAADSSYICKLLLSFAAENDCVEVMRPRQCPLDLPNEGVWDLRGFRKADPLEMPGTTKLTTFPSDIQHRLLSMLPNFYDLETVFLARAQEAAYGLDDPSVKGFSTNTVFLVINNDYILDSLRSVVFGLLRADEQKFDIYDLESLVRFANPFTEEEEDISQASMRVVGYHKRAEKILRFKSTPALGAHLLMSFGGSNETGVREAAITAVRLAESAVVIQLRAQCDLLNAQRKFVAESRPLEWRRSAESSRGCPDEIEYAAQRKAKEDNEAAKYRPDQRSGCQESKGGCLVVASAKLDRDEAPISMHRQLISLAQEQCSKLRAYGLSSMAQS